MLSQQQLEHTTLFFSVTPDRRQPRSHCMQLQKSGRRRTSWLSGTGRTSDRSRYLAGMDLVGAWGWPAKDEGRTNAHSTQQLNAARPLRCSGARRRIDRLEGSGVMRASEGLTLLLRLQKALVPAMDRSWRSQLIWNDTQRIDRTMVK
jgi:hypothetical protein